MIFSNPDLLLYIAMADAHGIACEYVRNPARARILRECLRFRAYQAHPKFQRPTGTYSDDAEMSVANALVLTRYNPPFTPIAFADAYVDEFRYGGRRTGYSREFQKLLESVKDGAELLARIDPQSTKNGAAMRAVPMGALPDIASVFDAAEIQARVTHDTHEGVFSARAVALMSHYALYYDEPLACLPEYCLEFLPAEDFKKFGNVFRRRWPGGPVTHWKRRPGSVATVHAVADLVVNKGSLMAIMRTALRWGGDTDSVAAIAWGIASARYQDEELPAFLERDLEGGSLVTGANYLRQVGKLLMEKYS